MIERVVTSGTFSLDGGTWEVDNNVWLVGDEREVLVIDAAHDAEAIAAAAGDRQVLGIVCTHAHDDHVNVAPAPAVACPGARAPTARARLGAAAPERRGAAPAPAPR